VNPTYSLLSACYVVHRWLLESLNKIDDLTTRSKSTIGRELAHDTRWKASTVRNGSPTMTPHTDRTPLPHDLAAGYQEVRLLDISTLCTAVGSMLCQLSSHQRELRSGGPAPFRAATNPHLQNILGQQKIQFTATVPENSGRRIKVSSPLFINLIGLETTTLVHDLLCQN
jgi:hypothetical protein